MSRSHRQLNTAERYSDAHSRAAGSAFLRYVQNVEKFAAVVAVDSFLSPSCYPDELPEARKALHDCWCGFVKSQPQTVAERAIGRYLAAIIHSAIEGEAERDAEAELESGR